MTSLLIVDDEEVIRILLDAHFTALGYTCLTARDGTEAMSLLNQGQVTVVITDLEMPGMNGIALLRAVRTTGLLSRCVVVTGYATVSNLTDCLREGAVALVPKTMDDLTQLEEAVEQACAQRRRWAEQMNAIVRLRLPTPIIPPQSALEPRNGQDR